MRYTINLDCKTHYVSRDGKFPILLRVSLNGEHDYLNTGKRIKEAHYDKEKKSVKAGITGFSKLASFIDRQKLRVENIISDFDKKGEIATISKIKDTYELETGKVKSKCFYEFVEDTIKWERANTQKSCDTLDNYSDQIKKLKVYRNKLTIHDIDVPFLTMYKSYIIKTLGQKENTAYHAMCFLRKYTRLLYKDGKISPYPFANFTVGKSFEVELEYLEPEELTSLHDLYDSKELLKIVSTAKSKHARDFNVGEKYQEVLRYFLVACYTGFRHSDIKTLERNHIKGKYIVKKLVKGREGKHKIIRIPIRKRLLSLLDMGNPKDLLFENAVMEDSQTNKYLKKIMEAAMINKHITFHKARYTFAIVSLILGIKFEVVSDILGHSEYTTTQRYAKVVNRLKDGDMDKWDKLAVQELSSDNYHEIICPACENIVLKLEKGVIKMNKIQCSCQFCQTLFNFNLKDNVSETSQKLTAVA